MFAENDRISHRQLFHQIVLSMIAPLFFCLTSQGELRGISGLLGIGAAVILLGFYGIFLVRLAPVYEYIMRHSGQLQVAVIAVLYGIYIIFTGAYILDFVSGIIGKYLLDGVNVLYVKIVVSLVCAAGSHKGLQKRARMGEVSYWIIVGALVLLLILAACQGQLFPCEELIKEQATAVSVLNAGYQMLCAFLPLTLLPFLLPHVAKSSSSVRSLWAAIGVLALFLASVLVLMPLALGWERALWEPIPVLPLLAGTNLPGDVLARFDVIWIALFTYAFLYSLGSLFYYGNHIFYRVSLPINRWMLWFMILTVSFDPLPGYRIRDYYRSFLEVGAAPVLFLMTVYLYFQYRRKSA